MPSKGESCELNEDKSDQCLEVPEHQGGELQAAMTQRSECHRKGDIAGGPVGAEAGCTGGMETGVRSGLCPKQEQYQ